MGISLVRILYMESHYKDRATVLSGYTKKAQWTE